MYREWGSKPVGGRGAASGQNDAIDQIERKRPAFAWSGDSLFYAKDCFLRRYQYSTQKDSQVIRIRRPGTPSLDQSPRTLSYSPAKNAILICSDLDGGSYELYIIPKDDLGRSDVVQDAKRGKGGSAVFIDPHLFAVLDKSTGNVQVKNLKNKVVQESRLTFSTDAIFYAGYGKLLCRSRDGVVLFDTQQRCILGNIKTPFVRYVVWAPNMESVALLSKNGITIASKTLDTLSILDDPDVIVKSGAWGNDDVFVYTTSTNIKCWHPNGVIQNIQTMEVPIYITKVSGNVIFYLDRDGENSAITINEPCFSSKKRKAAAVGGRGAASGQNDAIDQIERKRPAFAWSGDSLFYAKDCFLRRYQYSTQKDSQVIRIRRPGTPSLDQSPRTLSYSPAKNAILICSDLDGGSYELYIIPKDDLGRSDVVQDAKRGKGGSAVFIAPHLFAVLDKSTGNVQVKNLKNKVIQESRLTFSTDAIFYAGYGKLLCRSRDGVVLFDTQQRCILGNLKTPFVRYVVWAPNMESVALLSKNGITIASKTLDTLSILDDPDVIVKSGAWGNDDVFVYTTSTNIKCWHPNGVIQNIQTMEVPIYITKVSGNVIFYLDRDGENSAITINEPCFSSKKRKAAADGSTDGDLDQDGINSSKKRKVVAETANEKPTRIWWDLENAPVPTMYPQKQVYSRMVQTLRESNLTGPVTITGVVGYLDSYVPKNIDPRIKIVPARLYNRPSHSRYDQAADGCISKLIIDWLANNEEPSNVMFITGDTGFFDTIEQVKAAGHTILIAFIEGKEDSSTKIKKPADFYWEWRDFLSWIPNPISAKERKAQRLAPKQRQRGKCSHAKKMRKEKRRKENKKKNGAGL